jgi:hypothetical protein
VLVWSFWGARVAESQEMRNLPAKRDRLHSLVL